MLPTDPSRDKNFNVVRKGRETETNLRAQHEPSPSYRQDGVNSELVWQANTCTTRRKESSLNVIKPRQQIFHINDLNIKMIGKSRENCFRLGNEYISRETEIN